MIYNTEYKVPAYDNKFHNYHICFSDNLHPDLNPDDLCHVKTVLLQV